MVNENSNKENTMDTNNNHRHLVPAEQLRAFVLAGRADFTIENTQTGGRFTFKVCAPMTETENGGKVIDHDANVRFVKVLTGSNNTTDFQFLGTVFDGATYRSGRKSRIAADAPSSKAWSWFWGRVSHGHDLPAFVNVWAEGRCGRCGHKLTVPSSVATGFGPECLGKVGLYNEEIAEAMAS